jgi:hypothetical protein
MFRTPSLLLVLFLLTTFVLLAPAAALAGDAKADCTIDVKPGDLVAKGKDVVVEAGKRFNDVVAVDGNVIIRKNAHVKSALAMNGSVTIESGAKVTGSAIAFGGKVKVAPDAKVEGSRLELGDGVKVKSDDGTDVSFNLSIGGDELGKVLSGKITGAARDCRIVYHSDAGTP